MQFYTIQTLLNQCLGMPKWLCKETKTKKCLLGKLGQWLPFGESEGE